MELPGSACREPSLGIQQNVTAENVPGHRRPTICVGWIELTLSQVTANSSENLHMIKHVHALISSSLMIVAQIAGAGGLDAR